MSIEDHTVSPDEERAQRFVGRPHVVILGAGASRAAQPNGDMNGKAIPLMADFSEHVPIKALLERAGIRDPKLNFEIAYEEISAAADKAKIRLDIEEVVYKYFSELLMPKVPTLYDHLILALQPQDVIATFNWDPFLIQAACRNSEFLEGRHPRLLFLHGNVRSGFCPTHGIYGVKGLRCSNCNEVFKPSKLIFPISQKNYRDDPHIKGNWDELERSLKSAFMVTIFGYSAPKTDRSAMDLFKAAWGDPQKREFEQIEIIDIRDPEELVASWSHLIHTHHYEVHSDFYDSWIANHPRRTGEAWWNQYLEAKFVSNNPIPKNSPIEDLWGWIRPFIEVEKKANHKEVK